MQPVSLATFVAGDSCVTVALCGSGRNWTVTLASLTDDDMNVTYRFHTRELADLCLNVEKERLTKIGMKELKP